MEVSLQACGFLPSKKKYNIKENSYLNGYHGKTRRAMIGKNIKESLQAGSKKTSIMKYFQKFFGSKFTYLNSPLRRHLNLVKQIKQI